MCFGLKDINFEYFHAIASFIKNLLHLRVILIPMARQMSKYTTGNKLWSLWGCFGYLCSLKNLRVKLTLSRLITSFQTLPEIGLINSALVLVCDIAVTVNLQTVWWGHDGVSWKILKPLLSPRTSHLDDIFSNPVLYHQFVETPCTVKVFIENSMTFI